MSNEKINYNSEDLKDHKAVAGIIKDDQGRVLLQDHIKFDFWTFPSGKCKFGESVDDGLRTEMLEELGIRPTKYDIIGEFTKEYDRDGTTVKVDFTIFNITDYVGDISNREPDKHREIKYFTIDEIKKLPTEKTSHPLQFYLTTLAGGDVEQ